MKSSQEAAPVLVLEAVLVMVLALLPVAVAQESRCSVVPMGVYCKKGILEGHVDLIKPCCTYLSDEYIICLCEISAAIGKDYLLCPLISCG